MDPINNDDEFSDSPEWIDELDQQFEGSNKFLDVDTAIDELRRNICSYSSSVIERRTPDFED